MEDDERAVRQQAYLDLFNRFSACCERAELMALSAEDRASICYALGLVTGLEDRVARLKAELKAERDRRVEHRQMNQALNELVARLEADVKHWRDAWANAQVRLDVLTPPIAEREEGES